jgi:hypothetical protein
MQGKDLRAVLAALTLAAGAAACSPQTTPVDGAAETSASLSGTL